MNRTITLLLVCGLLTLSAMARSSKKWEMHDPNRPLPSVVVPGDDYAKPPSDAVVLFDGKDLSHFEREEGGPAEWKVENGYMELNRTGHIRTKKEFGDIQLHLEWMMPDSPKGEGQNRGNSGILLMGLYEVQVLDSYQSKTYADGQAAAIYGQHPPMVNACRPPGKWQTYDIFFRAPRFNGLQLATPARVTVVHNGVVVHEAVEFTGPTGHMQRQPYVPHPMKLPISIQDYSGDQPVRYRNIWVRPLGEPG